MQQAVRRIQQNVRVSFSYPVCFTSGLFSAGNSLFADVIRADGGPGDGPASPHRLLWVLDRDMVRRHPHLPAAIGDLCRRNPELMSLAGSPLLVEGGEGVKNEPANVERVQRAIHEGGVDRHSYVVAVGGGAVLDMAGYAAATAHRGVRLVRVPTTVLSQNDSAVGVKNGVNAFGKKNFLGTFSPPCAVLNDSDFLETLADRDWLAGIPEAIKVSLLKDAPFFAYMESRADALAARDSGVMGYLIQHCARLHLEHIASGDPFELGSSRPLDFGHWAAHKLESLSGYRIRHGEAVAVGLALDATYSRLTGLLPRGDWQRVLSLISALGLPTYAPELGERLHDRADPRCVLGGLDEFREHLGGRLTITLLRRVGEGVEVHEIDERKMADSVELLEKYQEKGEERGNAQWHLPARAAATR